MGAVDEVKARLDIVDVVGAYVRLQKAGRYFKGLCPFHTERTPSFTVYPDRQSWHCFGACATGGDVISFISRKENLDFGGALRLLAERAGVELRDDGPRREAVKSLQDANEAAALYFHGLLQNPSPEVRAARAYAEERGLDRDAISDFQIGYAPQGWDNLRRHLTARGFDDAKLVEAGLLIESDASASGRAHVYDRFRDRLMYPIRDDRGRVVGFGGRVLPNDRIDGTDTGPKYMNTPQTPIFDKGSILYGLDRAKDDIRQSASAVIVEGYMDVIAAHQHGYRNVVASMGTALTDRQATLLQRFAGRVVLAMDADEAGSAANLRGVQVVAAATERPVRPGDGPAITRGSTRRLDIRVLALPQGKDPDELIRADPGAWRTAIDAARPVIEHLFAVATAGRDLSQPEVRSDIVAEVLPAIAEVHDPVLQAHYLQRLSRLGRVSEDSLRRQLPRRTRATANRHNVLHAGNTGESGPIVAAPRASFRSALEEFCLALLYKAPELHDQGIVIDADLFTMSENRELFARWLDERPVREDEALREHYERVIDTRTPQVEMGRAEAAFVSCVARLEKARIKSAKEASVLALAEGEAGLRPGEVASIALERLEAGKLEDAQEDRTPEAAVSTLLLRDTSLNQLLHGPAARNETGRDQTEGGTG